MIGSDSLPNVDLLVYTIGYEDRSGYIARSIVAGTRLGLVFPSHHVLSFDANLANARNRGDRTLELSSTGNVLGEVIWRHLSELRARSNNSARLVVGIDVSSMTRALMSEILREIAYEIEQQNIELCLLYATAAYHEPLADLGPYIDFQPIQGCEGWTQYPERPLSAILGLGYEADQAIGAVEYLDPSGIWAFLPRGDDARYYRDLIRANVNLWPIVEPFHKIDYAIANPSGLYGELRGLVETLAQRSRVVLVPGGPKLFSALAILVHLEIGDEVSVWRASTHGQTQLRDVLAIGTIACFMYPRFRSVQVHELAFSE